MVTSYHRTILSLLFAVTIATAATGVLEDSECNLRIFHNPEVGIVVGCAISYCDELQEQACAIQITENVGGTVSGYCRCTGEGYEYPACQGFAVWDVQDPGDVPMWLGHPAKPDSIFCSSNGCTTTCVWSGIWPAVGNLEVPCDCS